MYEELGRLMGGARYQSPPTTDCGDRRQGSGRGEKARGGGAEAGGGKTQTRFLVSGCARVLWPFLSDNQRKACGVQVAEAQRKIEESVAAAVAGLPEGAKVTVEDGKVVVSLE